MRRQELTPDIITLNVLISTCLVAILNNLVLFFGGELWHYFITLTFIFDFSRSIQMKYQVDITNRIDSSRSINLCNRNLRWKVTANCVGRLFDFSKTYFFFFASFLIFLKFIVRKERYHHLVRLKNLYACKVWAQTDIISIKYEQTLRNNTILAYRQGRMIKFSSVHLTGGLIRSFLLDRKISEIDQFWYISVFSTVPSNSTHRDASNGGIIMSKRCHFDYFLTTHRFRFIDFCKFLIFLELWFKSNAIII